MRDDKILVTQSQLNHSIDPMSENYEVFVSSFDQSDLFLQLWTAKQPKGLFLITHGLSEYSDNYGHVAEVLNKEGWSVIGWDMRGHGRSDGKRGYVQDFSDLIQDLDKIIYYSSREFHQEGWPFVIFGHSMGGAVTLRYLAEGRGPEVTAACLSSPALGLAMQVPQFKLKMATLGAKYLPKMTLGNEIKYNDLTRDLEKIKSYSKDSLRHDKISPCLFLGMIESFNIINLQAGRVKLPVLMQVAGQDAIVSTNSALNFYDKLSNSRNMLYIYEDSLHEIYNDLDKEEVLRDLKLFLQKF